MTGQSPSSLVEHDNEPLITEKIRLAPADGVFELAGPEPAWIWVHTCPTPKCPCRSALVIATHDGYEALLKHGASVREAWIARSDYSRVAATLNDLIVFRIDIDTTEVSLPVEDQPFDLAAYPLIADIAMCIDGNLLESIGQLWYRGKGWPDPEQRILQTTEVKIKGWQRGEMLVWDDVCTGVRQDIYVFDGRLYEAAEMYCPVPDCDCGEVLISFETQIPRGAPTPGQVLVHRTGAMEFSPTKNGRDRLEQLWAAFQRRHPNYLARFARRYPTMKSIGARIVATPQAESSKVGRNESCPCGSGKKFKKCCGAG